ncbi:GFA family protein [Pseudomonas sp. NFR16]|uniref:GFA family protein n=1 Tax=Pseudomonas sp. NFR16 TaxID=1566248 RepID=UPI0008AE3686|nr:GFA family protein [Pseudomonas sp. NFR16]SEJ81954.1 Uncharacterized conserved protein [Pseudomonas sp. NFR16]
MDKNQTEFEGSCHCGAVQFRVTLSGGLATARRCDCSYCRMRGAVVVTATQDNFRIVAGEHALTLYQFNTHTAKHYFCGTCGIYTHHRRRSNPDQLGVNAACLAGVSPFDFAEVPVNDGVNHPSDRKGTAGNPLSGVLRFIPSTDA